MTEMKPRRITSFPVILRSFRETYLLFPDIKVPELFSRIPVWRLNYRGVSGKNLKSRKRSTSLTKPGRNEGDLRRIFNLSRKKSNKERRGMK